MRLSIFMSAVLCMALTSSARSQVTEYTSAAQWEQVVSTWTTIGFAEFPG